MLKFLVGVWSSSVFESFNIIYIPAMACSCIMSTAFFYVLQCVLVISLFLYTTLSLIIHGMGKEPLLSVVLRFFYEFIYDIMSQQLSKMQNYLVPHIFSIGLLILCGNLCGLVPFGFSITAFPGITLVLSSLVFFSCVLLAFYIPLYRLSSYSDIYETDYLYFLSFFSPHDVPRWLYPLIIVIEVISFFFRVISLGFRLAANLMAGHILIGLLSSAYCGVLMCLGSSALIAILFTFIVCVLLLFELFVSFLQTYVFVVLSCSYFNDIYVHFDAHH